MVPYTRFKPWNLLVLEALQWIEATLKFSNSTIKYLHMGIMNMSYGRMEDLASMLHHNTSFTTFNLYLSFYKDSMPSEGLKLFINALAPNSTTSIQPNSSLTTLRLPNFQIALEELWKKVMDYVTKMLHANTSHILSFHNSKWQQN